jgi:hypothetical protein
LFLPPFAHCFNFCSSSPTSSARNLVNSFQNNISS